MSYKRTATRQLSGQGLPDELQDVPTTDSSWDERRLQVVHLPDDRGSVDQRTGRELSRREVYELLVRGPKKIRQHQGTPTPVSRVLERHGPYGRRSAFCRVAELADERGLPLADGIAVLRPNGWTATADWVSCPTCGGDELTLVSSLDQADLTLTCRACDARADERRVLFEQWFHCPGCGSGDVNVELSGPHGSAWWSCDDCLYDTTPGPIDRGYTEIVTS